MNLNPFDPEPMQNHDDEDSTIYTATTPPETVAADLPDDHDSFGHANSGSALVPWPGTTFIIRSVSSGHVIMLLDGKIVLTKPGGRGSIHWTCIETKGWLAFRNTVSGKFLGHDKKGNLHCWAENPDRWEYFDARMTPEGGCVLLMTHYERLWHVGIRREGDVEKLAKIGEGGSSGIVWEFAKA